MVPFKNIILGDKDTYFIIKPCNIISNTKYCYLRNLQNINNDKCFRNILSNQNSTCKYVNPIIKTQIDQINNNIILIQSCHNLEVKSNCNFERNLTGHFLIKLNNCQIRINGIIYENLNTIFKEEETVQLLYGLDIREEHINTIILKKNKRKTHSEFTRNLRNSKHHLETRL